MVFSGQCNLPKQYADMALEEGAQEASHYKLSKLKTLVDFPGFMESMAKLVGCKPQAPSIFTPLRLLQYWLYPRWAYWFRVEGPHPKPEVIDGVLSKFPLERKDVHPRQYVFILLAFWQ